MFGSPLDLFLFGPVFLITLNRLIVCIEVLPTFAFLPEQQAVDMKMQTHVIELRLFESTDISHRILKKPFPGFGSRTPSASPVMDIYEPAAADTLFEVSSMRRSDK